MRDKITKLIFAVALIVQAFIIMFQNHSLRSAIEAGNKAVAAGQNANIIVSNLNEQVENQQKNFRLMSWDEGFVQGAIIGINACALYMTNSNRWLMQNYVATNYTNARSHIKL